MLPKGDIPADHTEYLRLNPWHPRRKSEVDLQRPVAGAILYVLYLIGEYLCHRFMRGSYHEIAQRSRPMNTLPSKAQVHQTISIVKSRESTHPNPMAEVGFQPDGKVFVAQGSNVQPARRLIVLVPNVDMDEVRIARVVWEMASPQKLHVLLLGMCIDISEEYQIQRRLINLAALIRDPRITVEFQIEYGRDWLRGVRSVLDDGDVILCHEEISVGLRHRPLVDRLSALHAPVWTLSGIYPSNLAPRSRWLSIIIFWFVATALMAGFFYLQIKIDAITDNLVKNVLLCLSVIFEIGSLYAWGSIFA